MAIGDVLGGAASGAAAGTAKMPGWGTAIGAGLGALGGILGGGGSDAPAVPPAVTSAQNLGAKRLSGILNATGSNKAKSTVNLGIKQLLAMLKQKGRIDPGLMNFELADIGRSTQGAIDQARARSRASGFQGGSGVESAIMAALEQAGGEQRGRRIAEENVAADARHRQTLQLINDLIYSPQLSAAGIAAGAGASANQLSSQEAQAKSDSNNAAMAALMQGLAMSKAS
jgi:hypothetical protein